MEDRKLLFIRTLEYRARKESQIKQNKILALVTLKYVRGTWTVKGEAKLRYRKSRLNFLHLLWDIVDEIKNVCRRNLLFK